MTQDIFNNDALIEQSLVLFKNWLAKHPFVKYNGKDNIDEILLFFLRVRKFAMDRAYECFEQSLIFIKSHPEWYENPGPKDYEFTTNQSSPLMFVRNKDAHGRAIWIYRLKNFKNFDKNEFFPNIFLTPLFVVFEKETQINGLVIIIDFRDMDLSSFKKLPMSCIYDCFKLSKNSSVRTKQFNLIGMPSFFKPVFEFGKSFTSAKILTRINLLQNTEELSKVMDVSILPKDYGGSANELLDCKTFETGINFVKTFQKLEVDFNKIQEFEGVGSFRKLEID
ncbi:unnamed protein product [Chironomus riparius]|uniref:CRAL-TRIO domain-containing protein n=1 Tax=Chironomus riparius TaxID=315576 RepID=A0A9N9WTA8_9DIPT|nr:unnamed protein product [Chironomus riparius]